MSDTSPVLSLPFIQPAQAQKHVTHNEALQVLDAVVQLVVASASMDAPPVAPQLGERYIVAAPGSGAWAGQAGNIAVWEGNTWFYVTPQAGWRAGVIDPAGELVFDPVEGWSPVTSSIEATGKLGINAVADATNRLSLSAPATLLSHEGAGHQLKLNKAGSAETASLLYQSNWSGCAEMGLMGGDDFTVKVSADGTTWQTALSVDATSGIVDFSLGATVAGVAVLGQNDLLGTVAETAGTPTGAVFERGSNADGDYVRFADGTQICEREVSGVDITVASGSVFKNTQTDYDFPMPFASIPSGFGSVNSTANAWINARVPASTKWSPSVWSSTSRTGVTVRLIAIGRWF